MLSKEIIEREISNGKTTLIALKDGIEINKIVLEAFETQLKKCT